MGEQRGGLGGLHDPLVGRLLTGPLLALPQEAASKQAAREHPAATRPRARRTYRRPDDMTVPAAQAFAVIQAAAEFPRNDAEPCRAGRQGSGDTSGDLAHAYFT
jgi:hypothetical protein